MSRKKITDAGKTEGGSLACPKCGGASFKAKRSLPSKVVTVATVGVGALVVPKRVGEVPDLRRDLQEGVRRAAAGVAIFLLAACAAENGRPGNAAVYDRIEASTDCSALQGEFDTAMESVESRRPGDDLRAVSLAYAEAADQRMRSLGCY